MQNYFSNKSTLNAIIGSNRTNMNDKQKHLKIELIKTAEAIRKKYKNLHTDRLTLQEQMEERFKPITSSLKSVLSTHTDEKSKNKYKNESKNESYKFKDESKSESEGGSEYEDSLDYESPEPSTFMPIRKKLLFSSGSTQRSPVVVKQEPVSTNSQGDAIDLSPYFNILVSKDSDPQYGIRRSRGVLKIGNSDVQLDQNELAIGHKKFKPSKGLLNLLFYKKPQPEQYTKTDLKIYKQILEYTNAHKKRFNIESPIRTSKKGYKYNSIIKPLFQTGGGLQTEYMITNSNRVDFSYWDDPNELVDRLRLLIASSSAGHTGHNNEIISIIEELREAQIIV